MQKLILIILALGALSAAAFGFITERPKGFRPYAESTEQQVAAQQSLNGTRPLRGSEDLTGSKVGRAAPTASEDKGTAAIIQNDPTGKGKSALVQMEVEQAQEKTAPVRFFIYGLLIFAIGLATVFGLKFYADRVVPPMPGNREVKL
jgi:hypothetical protein